MKAVLLVVLCALATVSLGQPWYGMPPCLWGGCPWGLQDQSLPDQQPSFECEQNCKQDLQICLQSIAPSCGLVCLSQVQEQQKQVNMPLQAAQEMVLRCSSHCAQGATVGCILSAAQCLKTCEPKTAMQGDQSIEQTYQTEQQQESSRSSSSSSSSRVTGDDTTPQVQEQPPQRMGQQDRMMPQQPMPSRWQQRQQFQQNVNPQMPPQQGQQQRVGTDDGEWQQTEEMQPSQVPLEEQMEQQPPSFSQNEMEPSSDQSSENPMWWGYGGYGFAPYTYSYGGYYPVYGYSGYYAGYPGFASYGYSVPWGYSYYW